MMRRCSRLGDGVPEFGPVLIYSGPVRSPFMTFRSDRFVELRQQMEWTMTSPLLVVTSFLCMGGLGSTTRKHFPRAQQYMTPKHNTFQCLALNVGQAWDSERPVDVLDSNPW